MNVNEDELKKSKDINNENTLESKKKVKKKTIIAQENSKKLENKKEKPKEKSRRDAHVRKNIHIGDSVEIEVGRGLPLKKGKVKRILTNVKKHEYGIKVELESGEVGRVYKIGD